MKLRLRRQTELRVIGLDISLRAPGVCVASGDPRKLVGAGLSVETSTIRLGENLIGPRRLMLVTRAVFSWLAARGGVGRGALVVTEGYGFSSQMAHSMGEIGGCIRMQLHAEGANLMVVPPLTLKKFVTGKGAGDKNVVMKHLLKRWNFDVDSDDQSDAFACAVLGLIDQSGDQHWNAVERDVLTNKVERYAGAGQNWGGLTAEELARGGRKRAKRVKKVPRVGR